MSMILAYLKKTAEAFLHDTVTSAVVAVPVHFNFTQRHAVEVAATAAGLQVRRLVTESSCAALAYRLNTVQPNQDLQVLVLDIGRGSTNVQLLAIDEESFEVRGFAGASHLGGDDFDTRLVSRLARQFQREHGTDLTGNARALLRLRAACESAKRTLSEATKAAIAIDSLCAGVDLYTTVTRAQFEEVCQGLFHSIRAAIERVLEDAQIDKAQVDKIVLVGGSARIPKVAQLVSDFFDGRQPTRVTRLNQDMVVAHGAALHAAALPMQGCSGSENVKLPEFEFSPVDSTPFSLGIGTVGGLVAPVAQRNALCMSAKTVETVMVTTTTDNQPRVLVEVYERACVPAPAPPTADSPTPTPTPTPSRNTLLARVVLAGIPPAPRGVPKLAVTFAVDAHQRLVVSVADPTTGRSSSTVVPSEKRGLSDAEVVDIVVEANVAAARAAARARLEGYADGLRRVLRELHGALYASESWLGQTQGMVSIAEYDAHREGLEAVVRPLAEQLAAVAAASDGTDGAGAPEVDVVDEEILSKWAIAVVGPDGVPPAARDRVYELEDDAMDTRD